LARQQTLAAERNADATWLELVPTLSAFGQERFTNATGFGESPSWTLGLSATFRLDPAQIGRARVDDSAYAVALAEEAKSAQAAHDQAEDAALTVDARESAARAARAESTAAKKALQVARARYSAQNAKQLDVELAERDDLQAEVNRIQADANLELARALYRIAVRAGSDNQGGTR
jgi:outer membrane protein TolC